MPKESSIGVSEYSCSSTASARDVLAGVAAGCEPHLVLTGKGSAYRGRDLPESFPKATRVHADLAAFADFLLAREAAVA